MAVSPGAIGTNYPSNAPFSIRSYHFIPYVAAEPFYESQYNKWGTTDLFAGGIFPVGRRLEFNTYYEHENKSGKRPNKQQNNASTMGPAAYVVAPLQALARAGWKRLPTKT